MSESINFPEIKALLRAEFDRYAKTASAEDPVLNQDYVAKKCGVSQANISNICRGIRAPDRNVRVELAQLLYPEHHEDPDAQTIARDAFIKSLDEACEDKVRPNPFRELSGNSQLLVRSTNFKPFAGSEESFLDRLFTRFLDLADIRRAPAREVLETKNLEEGDLLLGLWDALDRVVGHGLKFWRVACRMSLGGVIDARHAQRIGEISIALSQPAVAGHSIRIKPIVIRGEVGSIHCRKRLGLTTGEMIELDDLNADRLAARLLEESNGDSKSVPVVCVDDLTALRVLNVLGDRGRSVFRLNTRREIQATAVRRELPQYYLGIAARRTDERLVTFLDEVMDQFLSTEVESTAVHWCEIAVGLAEEVLGILRRADGDEMETQLWANAWDWVRYTMFLDSHSIAALPPSLQSWKPILLRARQLLHAHFGHGDQYKAVDTQVAGLFDPSGRTSLAGIKELCRVFDVELTARQLRPERYHGRAWHLTSVLRMALRDEESEIQVGVYDAANPKYAGALRAMRRLAEDLGRMYQMIGSEGQLAADGLKGDLEAATERFGGEEGRIVLGRIAGEEDEFVAGLCLTGLRTAQCEIRYLWVDPSFRGSWLGSQLVNHAVSFAEGRGCGSVLVEILPELRAATHIFVTSEFKFERRSPGGANFYVMRMRRESRGVYA